MLDAEAYEIRRVCNGAIPAAASRMAITRISAGIRSRYLRPRAMELSLITRPSAVEMAICADGSVGSGADSD